MLVNFWATWCPPCVEELPSLMTLQERMKGRGLVVVGVSIDVDGDAYHRFLKLHNINFVTVRDPDQKVAAMYGTSGWPETYIIDRQGVLRRKFVGPVDWNAPDVVAVPRAGCRSARIGSLARSVRPQMLSRSDDEASRCQHSR